MLVNCVKFGYKDFGGTSSHFYISEVGELKEILIPVANVLGWKHALVYIINTQHRSNFKHNQRLP